MTNKIKVLANALAVCLLIVGCSKEDQSDYLEPEALNAKKENPFANPDIPKVGVSINGTDYQLGKPDGSKENYLISGDILVGKETLEKMASSSSEEGRSSILASVPKWPNNTVHYRFRPGFSQAHRQAMLTAMNNISSQYFPIRFVQGTNSQGRYLDIFTDSGPDGGNYAHAGYQPNIQLELSLYDLSVGIAIHELGHTLGLLHEHQRHDRDNHIVVHNSLLNDFSYQIDPIGTDIGPFDWNSMMMYPSDYMGNGQYTMVRKSNNQPFSDAVEDGATFFSSGDINGLQALGYGA